MIHNELTLLVGDPTLPYFQPPHFDPPPIPSYSSRRVHSETPIYVPPHSSLWVMGHHSNITSSICTHLHADAHLWILMCTYACMCTSTTPPKLTLHAYPCMCMHVHADGRRWIWVFTLLCVSTRVVNFWQLQPLDRHDRCQLA